MIDIKVGIDFTPVYEAYGLMSDVAHIISDTKMKTRIKKAIADGYVDQASRFMDMATLDGQFNLEHMYKWGKNGLEPFRLFRFEYHKASSYVTFNYLLDNGGEESYVPLENDMETRNPDAARRRSRHIIMDRAWRFENEPYDVGYAGDERAGTKVFRPAGGKIPEYVAYWPGIEQSSRFVLYENYHIVYDNYGQKAGSNPYRYVRPQGYKKQTTLKVHYGTYLQGFDARVFFFENIFLARVDKAVDDMSNEISSYIHNKLKNTTFPFEPMMKTQKTPVALYVYGERINNIYKKRLANPKSQVKNTLIEKIISRWRNSIID